MFFHEIRRVSHDPIPLSDVDWNKVPCDMATLQSKLPWLKHPIVCAPMAGVAEAALAIAVSKAGALGMIGSGEP